MKNVLLSSIVVLLCNTANAQRCDQTTYDGLYKKIIQESMKIENESDSIRTKNRLIRYLRKLCNGQLSSWEYKNTYPKKGKYNVQD